MRRRFFVVIKSACDVLQNLDEEFKRYGFKKRKPFMEKEKAEAIKNDPRECIRADNILKQNVTRFPRVSTLGERGGSARAGFPFLLPAGVSLWTVVS